ncbi:Acyltransferase [Massilia sp. 9I]|nr:Acyltransferase [Massilia sp. 9I]
MADVHSQNLDVLRAMAVGFVVISHLLIEYSQLMLGRFHVQSLGTLGVLIFFVHTCLVLMQSLERHGSTGKHATRGGSFLLMRAFRIYPMSILVVLAVSLVERLWSQGGPSITTIVSNILLIQNLTGAPSVTPVLWSLPYEVQMYLFLPALFVLASLAGQRAWCWIVALWIAAIVVILLVWRLGLNYELVKFFPCFLPGVLAYCLRHSPRRYPAAFLFLFVCAGAVSFPALVGMGCSATVLSWVFCLLLGLILPQCRELRTAWLRSCGKTIAQYSYGIYLVHVPILYLLFRHFHAIPRPVALLLFGVVVPLLAFLAYHWIEKPGIAYGRVLARRINGVAVQKPLSV